MLANILVDYLVKGGWVMWPILVVFFISLYVVINRSIWWISLREILQPQKQQDIINILGTGEFNKAWQNAIECKTEPYLQALATGLRHGNTSMQVAMQLQAVKLIEKAESQMWILNTMITLAPLMGLFGTVIGIMGSFSFIGNEQLAPSKVSGGIAEALIATACGIAIAILCLLPYNYFRKKLTMLRSSLERFINFAELMRLSAKDRGYDLEKFAIELQSNYVQQKL